MDKQARTNQRNQDQTDEIYLKRYQDYLKADGKPWEFHKKVIKGPALEIRAQLLYHADILDPWPEVGFIDYQGREFPLRDVRFTKSGLIITDDHQSKGLPHRHVLVLMPEGLVSFEGIHEEDGLSEPLYWGLSKRNDLYYLNFGGKTLDKIFETDLSRRASKLRRFPLLEDSFKFDNIMRLVGQSDGLIIEEGDYLIVMNRDGEIRQYPIENGYVTNTGKEISACENYEKACRAIEREIQNSNKV